MSIVKEISYQAPSNIALVKYWGKHGIQLPSNPSISLTLDKCISTFSVKLMEKGSQGQDIKLMFEGEENKTFIHKIAKLFELIHHRYPIVHQYDWYIESSNTFPHSSGIASSASSMAALAMCIESLQNDRVDLTRASDIARLGSGSASRSVIPLIAWWGKSDLMNDSSDEYAIPVWETINSDFHTYRDTILIISSAKKSVSSTAGHDLMNNHPYSQVRFANANHNIAMLYQAMKEGDLHQFGEIVEYEALSLHALMMMSHPSFILLEPNTLVIIEKIKQYRQDTQIPVYFTIDAGPNIHLLYPEANEKEINQWIDSELVPYCEHGQYIKDNVGHGPKKLS